MRCACVDIGSNTTRVLVADVVDGGVREVVCVKAFTRLGTVLRATGALPAEAVDAVAATVAGQVALARELGAERLRAVATAAIRSARDPEALVSAVAERAGVQLDVLDGAEEARLAFAGATSGADDWPRDVAVVDVGGGSTELAVGTPGAGIRWSASVPIGSSSLTDAHGPDRLAAMQADARLVIGTLEPPSVDVALAAGGSAASTARLVGERIDPASIRAALAGLADAGGPDLEPERIRLLPAGLAILGAVSDLLGRPLLVGAGGLREGVCLELAGFTSAG